MLHGCLDDLERLCTAHPGLNPSLLLLRWPRRTQVQPIRYSANPAAEIPANT